MNNVKKNIIGGVFWTTFQTVVNKGFGFIIQMILARILFPQDYGLVGMAMVVISFIEVLNDLGMNAALVQRKKEKLTSLHFDTAFWTGIFWALFLYLLIFFAVTPIASNFFKEEKLTTIIPVISLSILISPVNAVHRAQLTRAMNFKRLALINNTCNIVSGIVSVGLALVGFGVWALVFYTVLRAFIGLPLYFKATRWFPTWNWDKYAFKDIFGFGIYTTFTSLFNKISGQIDFLLVGKFIGAAALGVYTFSFIMTNIIRNEIVGVINKVIYPVYTSMQDDKSKMLNVFLKVISLNNLLVYPIILGVYLFSEELLPVFFGHKWDAAVPIIRILCFAVFIQMLNNSHTVLLRAAGKVKLELMLQITKSLFFYVPAISIGIYLGELIGAALGYTIATFLGVTTSFYFMKKIFNLQLIKLFTSIKTSLIMLFFCIITTTILQKYFMWWFCIIYYIITVIGIYYVLAKTQIQDLLGLLKGRKMFKI